ncbi:molybdenum cofactor biosynthesis protein [Blastopirellula marina]|uniref:Molybdopterin molybdenumtransferase n=1 Tax=Blastopirellula marina TaxID=124 RepID=A0A2S8FG32_9BACT|nr:MULTISPECIES: gephyrin-like molybdotransferase Glp [Pirellulaceae]PQO31138.1 molybdenum cofactor biosynthesis protein [Blastopirellula marina]RCS51532.1 molybdopterin molybdenumtransferase MoeA [Bremerella cremea]
MLSVTEALEEVSRHAFRLPTKECPAIEAMGMALAEDLISPVESPAFDKAMMDGFAVIAADTDCGNVNLEIVEEITAGNTANEVLESGQAARIMTGAPLPPGADSVIMVEDTQIDSENVDRVQILQRVKHGSHVLKQGGLLTKGQVVIPAGSVIRPVEVGILADLAGAKALVHRRPTVAIISTGDELVGPSIEPGPGQIRNTNGPMLEAMAIECGAEVKQLGIVRDNRDELSEAIKEGLQADVLLISGGMSVGVKDFGPVLLEEQGVEKVFHKVHLKPGKPLWFGKQGGSDNPTLVFGLPGNPASSLVCFHLFVRTALNELMGRSHVSPFVSGFLLTRDFVNPGNRPVFFPAYASRKDGGGATIAPLNWKGSADLATLSQANALACFEANTQYEAGQFVSAVMV